MYVKSVIIFFELLFFTLLVNAQTPCTTLGQNPSTAFPVCGTSSFSQKTVPYCGGNLVPGPCGAYDGLTDTNPFWYKFTCFTAGTLGFVITPIDLNDDYDWQLFDVTGHTNLNDIYTDASLFVACNWSGNTGLTGASAAGTSLQNCAGITYPTFSAMPILKLNHNYLLLVSHFAVFTQDQKGYTLSFGGGTASIKDPIPPNLQSVTASCNALSLSIKLNKEMKCSSLAADGTDFTISPTSASITSATAISCNTGFDMESIELTLSKPLPVGNYNIIMQTGTDGNTLLDNCGAAVPVGNFLPVTILPLMPTPMDSLTAVKCAPQTLQLVFKKNIQCNSIAPDGSDFIVTGPSPIKVISAAGNCVNGLSNIINVTLASPIVTGGNYKIVLQKGDDGNTILDECAQQTPAGSALNFSVKPTVSANFTYQLLEGCAIDTLELFNAGNNVNQWAWQLDYNGQSNLPNPVTIFTTFGTKQISLIVTNGFCSDTSTQTITLNNQLKAAFVTNDTLCPEDTAMFIDQSIGNIISYQWNFGDGSTSLSQTPAPQHFPTLLQQKIYPVKLIIENNIGCFDTAVQNITVLLTCYIAVPTAFTPNGDGLNDYLYPLNALKADNLEFKVYNRVGQLIFSTTNWTIKWDGTFKGQPQDSGVFVWTLSYTNRETGKHVFQKGSTMLIR